MATEYNAFAKPPLTPEQGAYYEDKARQFCAEKTALQSQHARELEYLHQKIEDLGLLLWEWRVLGEKIARDGLTAGTEPALRDLIGEKP